MPSARLPIDEANRLQRLAQLGILDTPPERRIDLVTERALALFPGAPIAAVSLVDRERQWFKSRIGLSLPETERSVSFCAHAILGTRVLVVEDATKDHRFADNALVTGAPGIRFYAGAPLAGGLGSLCVIDTKPRHATPEEIEGLSRLARLVDGHLAIDAALRSLRDA